MQNNTTRRRRDEKHDALSEQSDSLKRVRCVCVYFPRFIRRESLSLAYIRAQHRETESEPATTTTTSYGGANSP